MPNDSKGREPSRRIALVFGSFRGGGVGRLMIRAAEELRYRGFAVDLVVGRNAGDLKNAVPEGTRTIELERVSKWKMRKAVLQADPGGIAALLRPVFLSRSPPGKLRYLPALTHYFETTPPDAVLAATAPFNVIALWARRLARLRARVVVSEHNRLRPQESGETRWRYDCPPPMLRHCYAEADAIVTVSQGVGDELAACTGLPRERITTVYNPVTGPDLQTKAKEPVDHPWFAEGEPPVILGVGVLKPQKDFPTLVKAFARLRQHRTARLMILGQAREPGKDVEYVARLQALPEELGVASDVSFPGWLDNPFAFMARANVFVLSSAWEGLANVVIEALACGCPVVSTDCPSGPAEILDHGRYGALVPVGDADALATEINNVLDAPPDRESLRARAELFSADRAIDRYLALLFGGQDESLADEIRCVEEPTTQTMDR